MIQIEIHWIWLVVILSNLIMTSIYLAKEWRWRDSVKEQIGYLLIYSLFGILIIIGYTLLLIGGIVAESEPVHELKFYYRFYFTNYFEKAVAKQGEELCKKWNQLSLAHGSKTKVGKRIRRHTKLLNKKFNYDFKLAIEGMKNVSGLTKEELIAKF